jgi:hypothetical protein
MYFKYNQVSFNSFPPKQLEAEEMLNIGNRTTFLALKPGTTPTCAVDQVSKIENVFLLCSSIS